MQPFTGSAGATAEQSNSRQGASELCLGAPYDGPRSRSTTHRGQSHPDGQGARADLAPRAAAPNADGLKRPGLAPKGVKGTKVVRLEAVGREESLKAWGLNSSARWSEAERRPRHSDELDGHDYNDDAVEGDGRELEELGFILDGGWTAVETTRGSQGWTPGARDAGMTSHRGVLHPDEHVDAEALRPALEAELGFTLDDVQAVYRQGRKSADQLGLRGRIDARLLELSESGANMAVLGQALGFKTTHNTMHRAIKNALARARKERSAAS